MTEQELAELRRIVSELSEEVINKERNRFKHGYMKEAYFYSGQYLAFAQCLML